MTRFLIHRIHVAALRWLAAGVFLLLLIEFSFCLLGGDSRHVWERSSYGPVPVELSIEPTSWSALIQSRSAATGLVLLIAFSGIALIGGGWGILAARFRKLSGAAWLSAPFSLFASIPGFWFVIAVAIYSYVVWRRPGFANELIVERGPNVLVWWNAAVVALPAMISAVGWQMRRVSGVIEDQAAQPYIRGLFLAGYNDEDIFYRNIFRRALPDLVSLLDGTVPFVLGSVLILEIAFRYEGIGALFVQSVLMREYIGILASGLWLIAIAALARMIREIVERLVETG